MSEQFDPPQTTEFFLQSQENSHWPSDPKGPESFKEYLELYSVFREYVKHEDSLINNRLGWVLTIHGFLYASYGLTIQKQLETVTKTWGVSVNRNTICNVYKQNEFFLLGICVVGIMISGSGLFGILAAQSSMRKVSRLFRIQSRVRILVTTSTYENQPVGIPSYSNDSNIKYEIPGGFYLPGLTGGGLRRNKIMGTAAAHWIPALLILSWIVAIILTSILSFEPIKDLCSGN